MNNNSKNKTIKKSKAQASMEYLMIVGFALVLTAPLLLIYATQTNNIDYKLQDAQANKATDSIIDAVDSVYYTGEGSKRTIKVTFPDEVISTNIDYNLLTITMSGEGNNYEVNRWTSANMTGSLSTHEGIHRIEIIHEGAQIRIQET